MKIVSPEEFVVAYGKVTARRMVEISKVWGTKPKFTSLMLEIMPSIAKDLGLKAYNADYYTLDTIFYENKDNTYFSENTTYAEYIAVAIEHENQPGQTSVEMNKLQILNTPLKVLITYPGYITAQDLLKQFTDIIEKADIFSDIPSKRKQLVIFGYWENDKVEWKYFEI